MEKIQQLKNELSSALENLDAKNRSRTLSIGATFYKEGATVQELLKQADIAMYTAKAKGKNRVIKYNNLIEPT